MISMAPQEPACAPAYSRSTQHSGSHVPRGRAQASHLGPQISHMPRCLHVYLLFGGLGLKGLAPTFRTKHGHSGVSPSWVRRAFTDLLLLHVNCVNICSHSSQRVPCSAEGAQACEGRDPRCGWDGAFRSQPACPGPRLTGRAGTEPAGLVWLGGEAGGDTILLSLDTFLAMGRRFLMAPGTESSLTGEPCPTFRQGGRQPTSSGR